MKNNRFYALLLFSFSSLFSVSAQADCQGEWHLSVDGDKVETRPNDQSLWVPATLQRSTELASCSGSALIALDYPAEFYLSGPGDRLTVQFLNNGYSPLQTTSSSSQGSATLLPLASNQLQTHFWLRIPDSIFAETGLYSASIDATIQLSDNQFSPRQTSPISLRVNPAVTVSIDTNRYAWLSGSHNQYYIDLGELSKGAERVFELMVKSNARVNIKAEAEHGQLIHETDRRSNIPYELSIRGQQFSPKTPYTSDLGRFNGRYPTAVGVGVKVAKAPYATAGKYKDTLTISVNAQQ